MKDIKKIGVWTTLVLVLTVLISFGYATSHEPQVGVPPALRTCSEVNFAADCLRGSYHVVNYAALTPVEITQPTADAVFIMSKFSAIENPSTTIISGAMTYDRASQIVTNMQYGPVILSEKESLDLRGAFREVFTDRAKVPSVQKEVRVLYDLETKVSAVEQRVGRTTILGYNVRAGTWEMREIDPTILEDDAKNARIANNNPLIDENKRSTVTPHLTAAPLQQDVQTASSPNINPGGAQPGLTSQYQAVSCIQV